MKIWPASVMFAALSVCPVAKEAAAQQVVSGRFYRHEVVGAAGLGDVTGLLAAGPSINDKGAVAFAGKVAGSLPNAVMVNDLGSTSHRTIITGTLVSFLGGLQINENGHVVALDASSSVDPDGYRQNSTTSARSTRKPGSTMRANPSTACCGARGRRPPPPRS